MIGNYAVRIISLGEEASWSGIWSRVLHAGVAVAKRGKLARHAKVRQSRVEVTGHIVAAEWDTVSRVSSNLFNFIQKT